MKRLWLVFLFVPAVLFSQSRKQRKALAAQQKADQLSINNLKSYVQHLGNKEAADALAFKDDAQPQIEYISNQFKMIGLQPKGINGYVQQFNFEDEKQIENKTCLKVNEAQLILNKEYIPLACSASKSVAGMPAMALHEKGVPWFTDVKDWLEENEKDTLFDINGAIRKEAARAAAKGATALLVYNTGNVADGLYFNYKDKTASSPIPVIYILPDGYKKYFSDHSQMLDIELNVSIKTISRKSNDLIGYIDNGASSTIVIETTYNRISKTEDEAVNKGSFTNDNSGPAMLIELARMLSASKAKHNNYLFISYSSEDMALQGRSWLSDTTLTAPLNYIIYLDNATRYGEDKKLLISNWQTSATLLELVTKLADKKPEINIDSTNNASIAYASFPKGVPSLTFYTDNIRKDTNGEAAMNYESELQIIKFIYKLIESTDSRGKLLVNKN